MNFYFVFSSSSSFISHYHRFICLLFPFSLLTLLFHYFIIFYIFFDFTSFAVLYTQQFLVLFNRLIVEESTYLSIKYIVILKINVVIRKSQAISHCLIKVLVYVIIV